MVQLGGKYNCSVWAGVGVGVRTPLYILHTGDGTMDHVRYQAILESTLLPTMQLLPHWRILHDNHPIHKTHEIIEWLEINGIKTVPHPARSPDLNPIENIWW